MRFFLSILEAFGSWALAAAMPALVIVGLFINPFLAVWCACVCLWGLIEGGLAATERRSGGSWRRLGLFACCAVTVFLFVANSNGGIRDYSRQIYALLGGIPIVVAAIWDCFLPKQKTEPNQALEPTSTAVTPPASAGDRASGTRGSS